MSARGFRAADTQPPLAPESFPLDIDWSINLWAVLSGVAVPIAALALVMTLWNLRFYRPAPTHASPPGREPSPAHAQSSPAVSICIPARNEERHIRGVVESALAQSHSNIEILVYNDHSTDATASILTQLTAADSRVRLCPVVDLPPGWNGKQFACEQMGRFARGRWLLFTDADVRLAPDCIARTLAAADQLANGPQAAPLGLLSTFPRQITGTLAEHLAVPMIFFILFSYLPMVRMRRTRDVAATAGCGQFLFARRDAWHAAGGHAAFKASMHDGIMLPRAIRRAGFHTDLFDGSDLCSCRMYTGLRATWRGFAKNAFEGLGSVALLVFITLMHALGHTLPWLILAWALLAAGGLTATSAGGLATTLAALAATIHLAQRSILAARFSHHWLGVILHPLAILMMTAIQWHSLLLAKTGRRSWRGRTLGQPHAA